MKLRPTERQLQLIATLEQFQPADDEERDYLAAIRQLAATPRDAFGRHRYRPGHITASAFVLDPSREKLLLVHHAKLDRWLQPGGHVEPDDETVVAAALREVREETGVEQYETCDERPFDLDIHRIPARPDAPEHHHFDVRYCWIAADTTIRASSESLAVEWVPLAQWSERSNSDSLRRVAAKLKESSDVP